MNCQEIQAHVEEVVENRLSASCRRKVNLHLSRCPECRAFLAAEQTEHAALFRALNDVSDIPLPATPSAALAARLVPVAVSATKRAGSITVPLWLKRAAVLALLCGGAAFAAWIGSTMESRAPDSDMESRHLGGDTPAVVSPQTEGKEEMKPKKMAAVMSAAIALATPPAQRAFSAEAACITNPYDDVKYMIRGGVDADGNGTLTHNSSELRCITKVGDPTHAWHTTTYDKSWESQFELPTLDVTCPYANQTLLNAPCLLIPQPATTNSWADITINGETVSRPNVTVHPNYLKLPNLLNDWTGDRESMSCSNYTFVARLRRDEAITDNASAGSAFLFLGYQWQQYAGKGLVISFNGATGSPQSYLQIGCGDSYWKPFQTIIPEGTWCEVAVIVTAPTVKVAMCVTDGNSHLPLAWGEKTFGSSYDLSIVAANRTFKLGGQSGGSITFTRGTMPAYPGSVMAQCFRGAVHTFAFWDRALSQKEVEEALAVNRPAVVKQGFRNGSSDEFTKAQDVVATGGRWEEWNPVLNASHPSASVTFDVNDMYDGLPQYLFLTPVEGGVDGTLDITIDGQRVDARSFKAGQTGLVYVPGSFLAAGSHTIAFRRTDSTVGDFAIDAFEIRGSWQVGYDRNGGADAAFSAETGSNHTLYLTDGNSKHLMRGYNSYLSRNKIWLYFDVPSALCDLDGRCRTGATFYTRADESDSTATHAFDLLVNGQTYASNVIWRGRNIAPENSPTAFTFKIPAGVLTNGVNCISWQKTGSGWIKCACYRLTIDRIPSGTMMIFR